MAVGLHEETAVVPETDWQVETLRFTLFPSPAAELRPREWWEGLIPEPSHARSEQRQAGVYEEYGSFGPDPSARLTLRSQPARVDWLLARGEPPIPPTLPTIGPFRELTEPFAATMRRWCALAPSAIRLAFGAVLLYEVPNHEEGYRHLGRLLPPVRLDPNSSDFLYRINRRRPSRVVQGLMINRISTWALLRHAYAGLTPDSQGLRLIRAAEAYACRVELDINTSQDFEGVLEPGIAPNMFDELVALGAEIARQGDL